MYTTLLICFPNQQLLSSPEGILQTVCCLAPNKSFSERFRKGNLEKSYQSFPANIFISIIHQEESPSRPHVWVFIESAH